jgi:hypothetical protein
MITTLGWMDVDMLASLGRARPQPGRSPGAGPVGAQRTGVVYVGLCQSYARNATLNSHFFPASAIHGNAPVKRAGAIKFQRRGVPRYNQAQLLT